MPAQPQRIAPGPALAAEPAATAPPLPLQPWLALCLLCGVAAIGFDLAGPAWRGAFMVAKPLTTVLIIALAFSRGAQGTPIRRMVLTGLVLSLLGDVALLWPQEGFLPGLVFFLLAHLAYLVAFTRGVRFASPPWPWLVYLALGGVILWWLWPGIGTGLRAPVLGYVAALCTMAAQAVVAWLRCRGTPAEPAALLAAWGGAAFVLSDALLAANKFQGPLAYAPLWVLGSYWVAQTLIALSLPARD